MPLQRAYALVSDQIPYLQLMISTGRHNHLLGWIELNVPHTFLVAGQSSFQLQALTIPQLYLLVLTRGCDQFIVGGDTHAVNVLHVGHNRHLR